MLTVKRIVFSTAAAVLACAAIAATAAAEPPGPLRAAGVTGPFGHERLSDERTVTRVGFPTGRYSVRSGPGKRYRTTDKLRFYTEDNAPETYLVLRSVVAADDKVWFQIRVPKRPNGSGLGAALRPAPAHGDHALRARQEPPEGQAAQERREGLAVLGRHRRPRHPTPSGNYWVRERLSNLGGNAAYGPWAFGTAAYSRLSDWPGGGVGGHPRHQRARPPAGAGLTRLHQGPQLAHPQLKDLMPVGTPIWIHA